MPSSGEKPFTLVFVCTGNTCRSPMAEVIARDLIEKNGVSGIEVRSAGVRAGTGYPASQGAEWAAAEAGLDLTQHESTLLSQELIETADLILTMGSSHLVAVQAMGGAHKSHKLAEYAGESGDVVDPFGAPVSVYQATYEEILGYVEKVLDRLNQDLGSAS